MKTKSIIAAVSMVILIIASIPLGMVRSVQGLKNDVDDDYYYDDTGYAVYDGVDKRIETSNSLIKVANKYVSEHTELRPLIDELEYNANKAENSYDDRNSEAVANRSMTTSFDELATALKGIELDENDAKYPTTLSAEMKSHEDKIRRSSYNTKAQEYNETISRFPVSIIKTLGIVKELEQFN